MASSSALRFAINLGNALLAKQLTDGSLQGLTVELARKIAESASSRSGCYLTPQQKVLLTMLRIINGILLF